MAWWFDQKMLLIYLQTQKISSTKRRLYYNQNLPFTNQNINWPMIPLSTDNESQHLVDKRKINKTNMFNYDYTYYKPYDASQNQSTTPSRYQMKSPANFYQNFKKSIHSFTNFQTNSKCIDKDTLFLKNITNSFIPKSKLNCHNQYHTLKSTGLNKKIQKIDDLYQKIKNKKQRKPTSPLNQPFKKRQSMFDMKGDFLSMRSQFQLKKNNVGQVYKQSNQFDSLRTSDKTYLKKSSYKISDENMKNYAFRHSISTTNLGYFRQFNGKQSIVDHKNNFSSNLQQPKCNFSLRNSKVDKVNNFKSNFQIKIVSVHKLSNKQEILVDKLSFKSEQKQKQQENECEQTARFNYQTVKIKQYQIPIKQPTINSNIFVQKTKRKWSVSNFIIGPCKGQGRFGKVYFAIQKQSNFMVALKVIKKQSVSSMFDQFIQQIKLQMYLSSPYIVKLFGFFSEGDYLYIIMQCMQEGSMFSLLKKKGSFSQQQSAVKLSQIAIALQQMHRFDIIHRDLKPQNIVLSFNTCKICDFGWAAYCKNRRRTNCGTLDYLCPQVIQGQTYSFSVDLWGLGVLLYQMLIGKPPFYNISRKQTIKKIKDCSFLIPGQLSCQSKQIIQCLLKRDPQQRLDISSILKLNFFKKQKQ